MLHMKLAIVSDIHGNLEAFQAVLADIADQGVEERFCLGDLVGYGPDPLAVIDLARREGFACVMGNHDQAVVEPASLSWFNPLARRSLELIANLIDEPARRFLAGLPMFIVKHGCRFVHGFPPDSARTYFFEVTGPRLRRALEGLAEDICFVGHTHELEIASLVDGWVTPCGLIQGAYDLGRGKHIINIGSVGQPRDGDRSAKYVLWDVERRRLEVRFVAYDPAPTVAKILALGLPEHHASRLL
ncbi:metallophosphoesterase [Desulfarculus baarsii DSM 2075]|uniref:Metallophosphoesterase n=2 Tax=Desulfarculus baarsii TaxID=453230 RepID=E1QGP9_DESB2|nr:metallophosphoesterase [Desulfarculus baarsii DSM 2075]